MKKPLLIVRIGPNFLNHEEMENITKQLKFLKDDFYLIFYNQEGVETKITLVSDQELKITELP